MTAGVLNKETSHMLCSCSNAQSFYSSADTFSVIHRPIHNKFTIKNSVKMKRICWKLFSLLVTCPASYLIMPT